MQHLLLIGAATENTQQRLAEHFQLHKLSEIDDLSEFLTEYGAKISAVATNGHSGVKPQILDACPNLKVISCHGVGYDGIDTAACVARGILVSHTPNVLNAEVANTALMLMLAAYRNLLGNDAYVRSGRWLSDGPAPLSHSPDNRTVGIVGMGRIGQEIAERLQVLNSRIIYHSRSPKDVPYPYYANLTDMAQAADVLVCITPGGPSTRKLINRDVLDALGPEGMLINVSRGTVVDEAELVSALQQKRLGYAGLDVFEAEPRVPEALFAMPNVVLLPHVGSATHETRAAMAALTVDNLIQFLQDGSVLTPVPECAGI